MGDFVVNFFESLGYVYFVSQCINRNEKYKPLHSYCLFMLSLVILTVSSYFTTIDQISLFLINAIAFLIYFHCFCFKIYFIKVYHLFFQHLVYYFWFLYLVSCYFVH